MGLLIDGNWSTAWYDTTKTQGRFVRETASFRNWITPDGTAGPTGEDGFGAESGRYHLYVSHACPWAHRTIIFRHIKQLASHISMSIVHPLMLENGWSFDRDTHATGDHLFGKNFLYEVYTHGHPKASGRVTVPVLWDKYRKKIVSNESSEIIRMFNSEFDALGAQSGDYYPNALRPEIEALNARIYATLNNGVYRCGFATTQTAYEAAITPLFDTLDWLEGILAKTRYLTGPDITEADWRLFTTLIRFDPVYVGHFKCNLRRIVDYPNLSNYLRDLYQQPGIAETVNVQHIKEHYYASHDSINPSRVVPKGPTIDFSQPHNRG